jgi:hypothetical protein
MHSQQIFPAAAILTALTITVAPAQDVGGGNFLLDACRQGAIGVPLSSAADPLANTFKGAYCLGPN